MLLDHWSLYIDVSLHPYTCTSITKLLIGGVKTEGHFYAMFSSSEFIQLKP